LIRDQQFLEFVTNPNQTRIC